jgi:hypothetical protein
VIDLLELLYQIDARYLFHVNAVSSPGAAIFSDHFNFTQR